MWACTHRPMHVYAHPRKRESVFPHIWMHLELFMCHTCLHIYRHVCACTTYVYTFVDTSNPAETNTVFICQYPGVMTGMGREKEGGEEPLPLTQHQQIWPVRLVFAWGPGHHRVCLFSLSGIDLLVNLLNITSGKKSTQQLSLIQEKD